MATKVISVKLTETELLVLDQLVLTKDFDSRSGVLRHGIGLLMDRYGAEKQTGLQIEDERRRHWPRRNLTQMRKRPAKKK